MTKHIKKHTGPLGKLGQRFAHALAPVKYERSDPHAFCPNCGSQLYSVTDGFYCGHCGWEDIPEPITNQEIQ
jgi:ribosomal protein S27AE